MLCLHAGHSVNPAADWILQVIRGNSVLMLEALERIGGDERGGR